MTQISKCNSIFTSTIHCAKCNENKNQQILWKLNHPLDGIIPGTGSSNYPKPLKGQIKFFLLHAHDIHQVPATNPYDLIFHHSSKKAGRKAQTYQCM